MVKLIHLTSKTKWANAQAKLIDLYSAKHKPSQANENFILFLPPTFQKGPKSNGNISKMISTLHQVIQLDQPTDHNTRDSLALPVYKLYIYIYIFAITEVRN